MSYIQNRQIDETTLTVVMLSDDLIALRRNGFVLWGQRKDGILEGNVTWSQRPPGAGWHKIATVDNYLNRHERMSLEVLANRRGQRFSLVIPRISLTLGSNDKIVDEGDTLWVYRNSAPLCRLYTATFSAPDEVMWADSFIPLKQDWRGKTLFVAKHQLGLFDTYRP